jgi:hypothetical protein
LVQSKLTRTRTGTENTDVPIIHGDEFFMPKHLCPLITYTSTPSDTAFCQASIINDQIGEYMISWNGTRGNDPATPYAPPGNLPLGAEITTPYSSSNCENNGVSVRVPSNLSIDTTFSIASTLHEGGRTKVFTISGPDTDCDEAVNFVRMFEALANASESEISVVTKAMGAMTFDSKSDTESEAGGVSLSSPTSEQSSEGGAELFQKQRDIEDLAPPHSHINMDIPALKLKYAGLIKQMRAKVREFLEQSTSAKLPKIQIIEAFLLFSDPSIIWTSYANTSHIPRLLAVFHSFLLQVEDTSAKLAQKGHIGEYLENVERTHIEQHIQNINSFCKRGMMEQFSCKLWLTTSEKAAKERRFSRPAYIDTKDGGLREPGQMWKTEGYFGQVAWKNHVEKHEWLVGENEGDGELGRYKDGVHIRAEDLGVEGTVRWAVGAILEEMGKLAKGEQGFSALDPRACLWRDW